MDLAPLLSVYPPDRAPVAGKPPAAEVSEVMKALGGVSLADGLYRVFPPSAVTQWTAVAVEAFPEFAGRATVFAADWLGRLLAADTGRTTPDGESLVLMLEPGTGEALEVPVTVSGIHTSELLDEADALVAEPLYRAWRSASGDAEPLRLTECVGFRIPLFLGGTDDVSNLERTDMEVYWSLSGQMRQQTEATPDGTRIDAVGTEKPKRGLLRRGRK